MVESEAQQQADLEAKGNEFIEFTPEVMQDFMNAFDGFVDDVFPYLTDWVAQIKAADVQ